MAGRVKLIRIIDGLYRTEDGGFAVARQLRRRGEPAHWTVRFTNFFSERVTREFPTLAACRDYIDSTAC